MSKIIQAILSGLLFSFIIDFFFFLGLFLNYIKPMKIDIYFNIFFVDNQNIFIYLALSVFIGYLIMFSKNIIKVPIILVIFLVGSSTLLPDIAKKVAEVMFEKKDVTLHNKKFTFRGDIYYVGREKITFFDKDLNKIILLDKGEIIDETY
jgi:hypothetical protein